VRIGWPESPPGNRQCVIAQRAIPLSPTPSAVAHSHAPRAKPVDASTAALYEVTGSTLQVAADIACVTA
jgi:hypothetical protein